MGLEKLDVRLDYQRPDNRLMSPILDSASVNGVNQFTTVRATSN